MDTPNHQAPVHVAEGQALGDRTGEIVTMPNGERWFHPYSGGAPIKLESV